MLKVNLKNPELYINGGKPVRTKEWLQNITTDSEEAKIAYEVVRKGNLSLFEGSYNPDEPFSFDGGYHVRKLEKEWSKYFNRKYSISMNSATSCLYASIGALNIGYGDEVIVSPFTMTACALAPLIYGAIPVFADVEDDTGCISVNSLNKKISKKTKALIIVHQFGFPAQMDEILKICKTKNIKIIEDCAQAYDTRYKGKKVGTFGDIGIFSLNVNKTIQTGEGGVCVTNSKNLNYRLRLIRNHGEAVVYAAKYKNITNIAGYNYRLTELSAAIALSQLKKLKNLNKKRLSFVNFLQKRLKKFNFIKLMDNRLQCKKCNCKPGKKCFNSFYIFPFLFKKNKINLTIKKFVYLAKSEGIIFYQGYTKPLYHQPLYKKKILFKKGYPFKAKENQNLNQNYNLKCNNAERLHNSILINEHVRHPHSLKDMSDIINFFKKISLIK